MSRDSLYSSPPPDLSGKALDRDAKKELLLMVRMPLNSYKYIMDMYNINYNTIRGYYKKFAKHRCTNKNKGRPRKLDEISCENIHLHMIQNPGITRRGIIAKIKEELIATDNRKYPDGFPEDYESKIAYVTLHRLCTRLILEYDFGAGY